MSTKRTKNINIRITDEQYEYLQAIAKPAHSSLSAAIIMLMGEGIEFRNIKFEEDRIETEKNRQWFADKEKEKLQLKLDN